MKQTFTLSSGREVTLSENERIILERMVDEDGEEYTMTFGAPGESCAKDMRFCPKDQGWPLIVKGLTTGLVGSRGTEAMEMADGGREVLAQMRQKPSSGEHEELSLDDLINLVAERASILWEDAGWLPEEYSEIKQSIGNLNLVIDELRARRDAEGPARARVGEYLRQKLLQHQRTSESKRWTRPRGQEVSMEPEAPTKPIDQVREDMYATTASLTLDDLANLAPIPYRDTHAEFMARQKLYLNHLLEHGKYSDKQQEALVAISQGKVSWGRHTGFSFEGKRLDGRTVDSLRKRGLLTVVTGVGFSHDGHYCLKRPEGL